MLKGRFTSAMMVVLVLVSMLLAGCDDDRTAAQSSADSGIAAVASADTSFGSPVPTETAGESDGWATESFAGLAQYEPGFRLENYPVIYQSQYALLRAAEGCMTLDELEAAATDIDNAVGKIQTYLGATISEQWNAEFFTVFIAPGQLQRVVGVYQKPVVFLSPDNSRLPLYAHEITHLVAGCKDINSEWMVEGLAVYLNSVYSAYPTWPQYDDDIDDVGANRMENIDIAGFETETGYFNIDPTAAEGEAYYVLAGSFVKYLIGQIGIEKYMTVYQRRNADEGLLDETGKDIVQWKAEWIEYLSANN